MPHTEHVEKLLRAIGPFYEYVNEDSGNDEDEDDQEVARNNKEEEVLISQAETLTNGNSSKQVVLNGHPYLNGSSNTHKKQQVNGDVSASTLNGSAASSSNDREYPSGN